MNKLTPIIGSLAALYASCVVGDPLKESVDTATEKLSVAVENVEDRYNNRDGVLSHAGRLNEYVLEFCLAYIGGRDETEIFLTKRLPEISWRVPQGALDFALMDVWARGEMKQCDKLIEALIRLSYLACAEPGRRRQRDRISRMAFATAFGGVSAGGRSSAVGVLIGDGGMERTQLDTLYLEFLRAYAGQPSTRCQKEGSRRLEALQSEMSSVYDMAGQTLERVRYAAVLGHYVALDPDGLKASLARYMEKHGTKGRYAEELHCSWMGVAITKMRFPDADREVLAAEAEAAYTRWQELFGDKHPRSNWGRKMEAAYAKMQKEAGTQGQ